MESSKVELSEVEIRQDELAWQKRRFFVSLAVATLIVSMAAVLALNFINRSAYDSRRESILLEEIRHELFQHHDTQDRIFQRLDELQQRQNNLESYSKSVQAGLVETQQLIHEQGEDIRALMGESSSLRGN